MMRLLALFLASTLMIGSFAACGGNEPEPTDGNKPSKNPEVSDGPEITEVVLVKSSVAPKSVVEICNGIKTNLSANTKIEVSIVNDYQYTYEQKDGRVHFYIGEADVALTESAKDKVTDETAVVITEDDKTAFYANNEGALWLAVSQFLDNCVVDGGLKILKMYDNATIDYTGCTREKWKQPIPAYVGGTLESTLFSAGVGANLNDTNVSDMSLVRETNAEEFSMYVENLEFLGYTPLYSNTIDNNIYCGFTDSLGIFIHTYYMASENIVRTVVDRNSTPLAEFCYTAAPSENSAFYMFNHNSEGENTFLIHCSDNSWIFIDGGVSTLTDKYAQGLFKFMSEKSNLQDGEKLVISAWYLTHAHRDHFQAFYSLINQYHDRIDLQRMIANLPDAKTVTHNTNWKDFEPCMTLINQYYPNLMYMKAHTGMDIHLADVNFRILCSQEDILDYWVLNKKVWTDKWSKWGNQSSNDADYKTNRDADKKYDINNSSLISKITIGNGMTVLELGDMFRANNWLFPKYTLKSLTTDILILAHHFINDELLNTYEQYLKQAGPIYGLCTSVTRDLSAGHLNVKYSFREGDQQYFVRAKYDTIFGFTKKDGKVTMKTYDAYYSKAGKIDNLK